MSIFMTSCIHLSKLAEDRVVKFLYQFNFIIKALHKIIKLVPVATIIL